MGARGNKPPLLTRIYPNNEGWPISPEELNLPETRLDAHLMESYNNHHSLWTARKFGGNIISLTCRNLSAYQDVIPKDLHNLIHARYEPAPMPRMESMMDRLEQAYEERELQRTGSAQFPIFRVIDRKQWQEIHQTYTDLSLDKKKIIIA